MRWSSMTDHDPAVELRAAWDALIAQLGDARAAIDEPRLLAPPPCDRNLAVG
jgi:hypothetical protein